jgi:UPF0755 protein
VSRRRTSRRLVVLFSVLSVLVVLAIAAGASGLYARSQLEAPAAAGQGHRVTITVASGETVDRLATDLESHGVVRSAFWFRWFARFKGLDGHLQAGSYVVDSAMGASAVIATLEASPQTPVHRVVLAEGLTAAQMAQRVEAAGTGISAADYLEQVRHGTFSESFLSGRPAGASLEGFLFPDTYVVPGGTSAHDMVAMQLHAFAVKAAPLLGQPVNGLSAYQLVVMASIVEREARFDDDRPKVASVFYNRLAAGMDLQADATVLYGLGLSGQSPSLDQLKQDTPYNTYLHPGLTPTPIANPGVASISAVVHPIGSPYRFYVSDRCGHNHYSVTQAEHDRQVALYLNAPC